MPDTWPGVPGNASTPLDTQLLHQMRSKTEVTIELCQKPTTVSCDIPAEYKWMYSLLLRAPSIPRRPHRRRRSRDCIEALIHLGHGYFEEIPQR